MNGADTHASTTEAAGLAEATTRLLERADVMGIEIDREEARSWIEAMTSDAAGSVTADVDTGIYGHRVATAQHDASELDRFRRMSAIVGFEDQPPQVMTALALSGSAAQAKIHRFPADADFFERAHIRAGTREEACRLLAGVMRDKALATLRGAGYRLREVKFGIWQVDGAVDAEPVRHGMPVSWTPAQVEAGYVAYRVADGTEARLEWNEAAADPGWCKLDWVIADRERGLTNASNVLDVTWEAPDGTVTPLDGFLDPYFQEVYLEADSIPLFSRLVKEIGADSVAEYVERLNSEVYKYTAKDQNYGKAARRMYNIFRITGRHAEAAYIRELFDEPVTALYQVSALLRTLDEAASEGDAFGTSTMVAQVDQLIMSAIAALEGRAETEMARRLHQLRDALSQRAEPARHADDIARIQADVMTAANEYFKRVLTSAPSIRAYLDGLTGMHPPP